MSTYNAQFVIVVAILFIQFCLSQDIVSCDGVDCLSCLQMVEFVTGEQPVRFYSCKWDFDAEQCITKAEAEVSNCTGAMVATHTDKHGKLVPHYCAEDTWIVSDEPESYGPAGIGLCRRGLEEYIARFAYLRKERQQDKQRKAQQSFLPKYSEFWLPVLGLALCMISIGVIVVWLTPKSSSYPRQQQHHSESVPFMGKNDYDRVAQQQRQKYYDDVRARDRQQKEQFHRRQQENYYRRYNNLPGYSNIGVPI